MSYKLISQRVSSLCDVWYVSTQKWHNFHVLLLVHVFKWLISTTCVARGNILLQLLDVLHKAIKWVLLQDLACVMPQVELKQKDAFTSSKINLVESPHFKVVHLHQDKWLISTKHFEHITVKHNKQPKVGVFEEARRSHVKRKHKKIRKRKNTTQRQQTSTNINSWLQHWRNERMSGMALNSQLKRGSYRKGKESSVTVTTTPLKYSLEVESKNDEGRCRKQR